MLNLFQVGRGIEQPDELSTNEENINEQGRHTGGI